MQKSKVKITRLALGLSTRLGRDRRRTIKNSKKYFVIFSILFLIYVLRSAFAAVPPQSAQPARDGLNLYNQINPRILPNCANGKTGFDGAVECVKTIAEKLQPIAAVLLVLAITISGAYLIFSQANESLVQSAKKIIFWSIIGLVIVFSAGLIRGLIREIIGK